MTAGIHKRCCSVQWQCGFPGFQLLLFIRWERLLLDSISFSFPMQATSTPTPPHPTPPTPQTPPHPTPTPSPKPPPATEPNNENDEFEFASQFRISAIVRHWAGKSISVMSSRMVQDSVLDSPKRIKPAYFVHVGKPVSLQTICF